MSTDISEEDVASFFRVQEETRMKQVASFMLVSFWLLLLPRR
jgi:hypothetical protein